MDPNGTDWENLDCTGLAKNHILKCLTSVID
jgi:hypothetical protein